MLLYLWKKVLCFSPDHSVCLPVCVSVGVCLSAYHQGCDEMAGIYNTVLSEAITLDNSSTLQHYQNVSFPYTKIWMIRTKSHLVIVGLVKIFGQFQDGIHSCSTFFVTIHSSFTTVHSSFTTIHSSFTTIHSSFTTIHSSFTTIRSSFTTIHSGKFTCKWYQNTISHCQLCLFLFFLFSQKIKMLKPVIPNLAKN